MRFCQKGNLIPRYIGPYEVCDCVGPISCRLALPLSLFRVLPLFYLSIMKKYHGDGDDIIKQDSVLFDKDLLYDE